MRNKRGLSAVVSTILLVLLAITSVVLIAGILLPYIRGQLDKGKSCYDTLNKLNIKGSIGNVKTCYNENENWVQIVVSRDASDKSGLKGFAFSLSYNGDSQRFDIIDKSSENTDVAMYKADPAEIDFAGEKIIPEPGTEKTYVVKSDEAARGVQIAPILENGELCKESDIIEVTEC